MCNRLATAESVPFLDQKINMRSSARPIGYKTFFMINSTEHEISTAQKNYNTDK